MKYGGHTLLSCTYVYFQFFRRQGDRHPHRCNFTEKSKGDQIFSEGLEATAFFIVVSGKVKIYKLSPDGKEYTLHIHGPGDPFAEAAIFDSLTYPASCVALENTTLLRISKEDYHEKKNYHH
jgi:CRP/FNR family transcriptional regulator, dissimilatory nitrate respiration regulator